MTHDLIQAKLDALRRTLRRLILTAGLARVVLVAIGLAAAALLVDWVVHLDSGWRLALGLGMLATVAAAAWRFLVRPLLVPMTDRDLALLYERQFPELSDLLVSAVELPADARSGSRELVDAVVQQAETAANGIEPRVVPRLRRVKRFAWGAAAAVLAAVTFCVVSPASARTFAGRFLAPFGDARWPRNTELTIRVGDKADGDVTVARGDQVPVTATAINARDSALWQPPGHVRLEYRFASGSRQSRPMRRIQGATYQAYFDDVVEGFTVRARARYAETRTVTVRVVQLPRVEDVWLSLRYPTYTGREPGPPTRSLTEVRALVGTRVRVEARASKPGCTARVAIDPEGSVPMDPAGDGSRGTHVAAFALRAGMRWFRIELTDPAGLRNKQPRTFQLHVLDDKVPDVRLVEPGRETRCTPYATVPLRVALRDDLALRSAWLRFKLDPKAPPQTKPLELGAERPKEAEIAHRWDISLLGVKEGQTISYRAEADDFRDVFPPGSDQTRQVGRSKEYFIRIVSAEDLASELDRRVFALRNRVKSVRTRQEAARRQVGELIRKVAEGQALTNDDRRTAADAQNAQREMARTTARVADEVGKVRARMKDNRIGSFEDLRRLEGTKAALKQLADETMPRAASFVQDARKDLASRAGRDNLQNAARVQDEAVRNLDKILAEMSHNEGVDNLVRAARELLRKQRDVKKDTAAFARRPGTFGARPADLKPADAAALNLLARRQRAARDAMRNLEQDMLNVFEQLKDADPTRAELVRRAQQEAGTNQIRARMEDAAGNLQENKIGSAAQDQDGAIAGLEKLLEQLEQARQQAGSDRALARALQDVNRALADVSRLHKQQTGHASDAAEINRNAAQAKDLKKLRRQLNRLRKEQDDANVEAGKRDQARLKDLAERERTLAKQADDLAGELDKQAKDAATRGAPQAKPIRNAAGSTKQAGEKMNAAQSGMQKGDKQQAGDNGRQASDKLADAQEQIDRAIAEIEKKRLRDTRDVGLKQGETARQAEEVKRLLKQLSKQNEQSSKEASDGMAKAGEQVGQSQKSMQDAESAFDRKDNATGERETEKARDQLAEAQQQLRTLRDDLQKKLKEQKLIDLLVELQPMLEKQVVINDETRRIDTATAASGLDEPVREHKVRLGQLAGDQSDLADKATSLLRKVEGENAPVFVWGFKKATADMDESRKRLVAFNTDSYTQDVQKDVADTLRMLIDALKQEQQRLREGGAPGGGGGGGGGGKPMLVPPAAQLKLLKARELEIHNQTKRIELRRKLQPGRPPSPLERKRVRRLAVQQGELADLAEDLAEALEKEIEEQRQNAPIDRPDDGGEDGGE
jgi:hypothetical protein